MNQAENDQFKSLTDGHKSYITSASFYSSFTFNSGITFCPKWCWSNTHQYSSYKKYPSIHACAFDRLIDIGYVIGFKQKILLVKLFIVSAKKLIASSVVEFWQCILGSEMWNCIDYGRYWYHQATFKYSKGKRLVELDYSKRFVSIRKLSLALKYVLYPLAE